MARRLKGEEAMAVLLTQAGIPHAREYRFHAVRKWRFDFAVPQYKVAVEIEGGIFASGRHTRGIGFVNDCEKYNAAVTEGWAVLRYPAHEVKPEAIAQIMQVIKRRQSVKSAK